MSKGALVEAVLFLLDTMQMQNRPAWAEVEAQRDVLIEALKNEELVDEENSR